MVEMILSYVFIVRNDSYGQSSGSKETTVYRI